MLSRNKCIFFLFEELTLIILLVMQLGYLVRLLSGVETIFPISYDFALFQTVTWIFCFIVLLLIGYYYIAKRNPLILYVHKNFSDIIFETTKSKIKGANRQIVVLVLLEMLLVFFIAVSIYVYLDPEVNLVPFPWNIIIFGLLLFFMVLVFNKTRYFREATYGQGFLQSIFFPHKHYYPIKRSTHSRAGTIHIKPKHSRGVLKRHRIKKK